MSIGIRIEKHGSLFLLCPRTDVAREWVEQNIGRDNGFQPYWPTVVVEHRYVADIVEGASETGLEVR